MQAFTLIITEALSIECNNAHTICLLVDESMKFQTKLWHIDIHSHWLRQEVQRRSIHICWVPTKEIMANGLIKVLLSAQKHDFFIRMTGIEDQKDLLVSVERKKNACQLLQTDSGYSEAHRYGANAT